MSAEVVPYNAGPAVPTEGTAPAVYDPAAAAAILALMDQAADEDLKSKIPQNTQRAYRSDWKLWIEFHAWLTRHNGEKLPLTAVTKGTLVGFVNWLDQVKQASPNSIDRHITGVTVIARQPPFNAVISKVATKAARQALKPFFADEARMARGRGKAPAATPAHLRQMNEGWSSSELLALRDRAMRLIGFGIAGRSEEVSALNAGMLKLVDEGLEIHVPSVKDRPARDVVVRYARDPQLCPVRTWLAWREAAEIRDDEPAWFPMNQWGQITSRTRLMPGGVQNAVKRAGERAGIPVKLTSHSLRAGFITTAIKAGKRRDKVRAQSGHSEKSPVFEGYIRDAEKWDDDASDGLL